MEQTLYKHVVAVVGSRSVASRTVHVFPAGSHKGKLEWHFQPQGVEFLAEVAAYYGRVGPKFDRTLRS